MTLWKELTACEQNCSMLFRNGFNIASIAIINGTSWSTANSHLQSVRRKAKATTISEAIFDLVETGNVTKMHPDEKTILQVKVKEYIKKFGKPTKKSKSKKMADKSGPINKEPS